MKDYLVTSTAGGFISGPFNTLPWLILLFFLSIAYVGGGNLSSQWFIQGAATFLYLPVQLFTGMANGIGIFLPIALLGLLYVIKGLQGFGEDFFLLILVSMIIIMIGA